MAGAGQIKGISDEDMRRQREYQRLVDARGHRDVTERLGMSKCESYAYYRGERRIVGRWAAILLELGRLDAETSGAPRSVAAGRVVR